MDMKALKNYKAQEIRFLYFLDTWNLIDDFVTPKQYKGMMEELNRAISTTTYDNIRPHFGL